jgi:hypothetical protein
MMLSNTIVRWDGFDVTKLLRSWGIQQNTILQVHGGFSDPPDWGSSIECPGAIPQMATNPRLLQRINEPNVGLKRVYLNLTS